MRRRRASCRLDAVRRGHVAQHPARTARHAASTAPPDIHVWRLADVEPAEPIVGVGRGEHDLVDAEHLAGDLLGERDEALPDLGARARDGGDPVVEPAPGGRVVVEALGEHEVLEADGEADAAPHVGGVGGAPGAAGQAIGSPARRRLGQRAAARGAGPDDLGDGQRCRR